MIVVTGAAGFIGSRIATQLNRRGRRDLFLVDHLACSEKWKNLRSLVYEDYLDRSELMGFLDGGPKIEAIIHMGACSTTTERDADFLMQNNYRYTRQLASWCLANDVRFIYASSAATYGDGSHGYVDDESTIDILDPLNMYGYSKHLFDQIARQNDWFDRIVGLKLFNVYGPNESFKGDMASVVYKAFHQIRNTGQVKLFKSYHPDFVDGGQRRDFVYVKDVVNVVMFFLKNPGINGLFNLGTGLARSFEDLAKATFKAMGVPAKIEFIDMPENLKAKYQYFTQADMRKLKRSGYKAAFMSLEEGVGDYVRGYLVPEFGKEVS